MTSISEATAAANLLLVLLAAPAAGQSLQQVDPGSDEKVILISKPSIEPSKEEQGDPEARALQILSGPAIGAMNWARLYSPSSMSLKLLDDEVIGGKRGNSAGIAYRLSLLLPNERGQAAARAIQVWPKDGVCLVGWSAWAVRSPPTADIQAIIDPELRKAAEAIDWKSDSRLQTVTREADTAWSALPGKPWDTGFRTADFDVLSVSSTASVRVELSLRCFGQPEGLVQINVSGGKCGSAKGCPISPYFIAPKE